MERTIVPKGAKLNLETVFYNIQSSSEINRIDLMERIFSNYGVVYSGEEDTSMEIFDAGGNLAQIRPGYGLTSAGEAIVVKEEDPITDRQIDIASYNGPLYIKSLHLTDTPTQILDGFAWLESGEQFRDTHQYDYYELTKTDPGSSGILLATFSDNGTTITDNRASNRLQVKPAILDDWTRERLHLQNTDNGTTSETFKIGVGTLGTNNTGLEVDTIPATPMDPLKPRITSIVYNETESEIEDPEIKLKIPQDMRYGELEVYGSVTFDWGYDYLEGIGGTDEFTITGFEPDVSNTFKTFTLNELVGYGITINGYTYTISGNDVTDGSYHTRLDLVDVWGNPAGSVPTCSSSNPAVIHSDATAYEIMAVPYNRATSSERFRKGIQKRIQYGDPKRQTVTLDLNYGWRYKVKITAKNKETSSNTITMGAGEFIQNNTTHSYDSDFLVELPSIDMSTAAIGAVATDYGFDVTVTGMDSASNFEICWTSDNSGADFTNRNHYKNIVFQRKIPINTNGSREYDIKLRPLQGGFVVSSDTVPYVDTTVISGGGGKLPNEKLLSFINVDMYAKIVNSGNNKTISGDKATIGLTLPHDLHKDALMGKRLYTESGQEYEIESNGDSNIVVMELGSGKGTLAELDENAPLYIGDTSKDDEVDGFHTPRRPNARRIYAHTFPNDVRIVAVDFDCDITDGTESVPGVLRFWQMGYPDEGKNAEIWQTDNFYTRIPINLIVRGSKGARILIIDAWDSSGTGNLVRLKGVLTVHYRDLVEDDAANG